ncbi:MAG TPA: flagellar basal body rod protein FlgC [Thermodesulfobacteriota bacterium]|nr:flagellar basal body rod protein FlgC [Deltaproteobacteria bacterium]HNR12545.1 flagellar basal body rod protein FlgC [Thermodesulfobacteriota bacterium]HNU70139.1 flagellar basal body rod protein FlgC [Thermodesulfobacteriota bacterium]HOC39512.1 flagellar basal body rod protein FlgC [Thermodesulfobacteriota bacterium]HQO77197.1 flagellar basal body rod protein FlgC [Thermodesulfobacteriota bacterium]
MNFFDAIQTSSSGLSAQRLRMDTISSNLANVDSTRTPEGGPYRRKDVVFAAQPMQGSFREVLQSKVDTPLYEVKVAGVITDPRPPQMKYDPAHPDANEEGYVATPNINAVEEMVNLISATRSYEAGVTAVNATKKMALKALEIGR